MDAKNIKYVEVEVEAFYTENGWVTNVTTYITGNPFDLKRKPLYSAWPGGQLVNRTEKKKAILMVMDD